MRSTTLLITLTTLAAFDTVTAAAVPSPSPPGLSIFDKRQAFGSCQQVTSSPARVSDAVWCINDIARRGKAGQNCDVSNVSGRVQCRLGTVHIVTVRGRDDAPRSVNCNDIARSAGVIMDRCTRGDGTVSGIAYIPQGGVAVHIAHS